MSSLDTIRDALADALDAIQGLQGYARVPGQVIVPAAVVAPDGVEYDTDFDGGATYRLPVQFLVQLGEWDSAQETMDALIAHDGTATAAIQDDTGIESRVIGMENYGLTEYAGTNYLGAQLVVEVIL